MIHKRLRAQYQLTPADEHALILGAVDIGAILKVKMMDAIARELVKEFPITPITTPDGATVFTFTCDVTAHTGTQTDV